MTAGDDPDDDVAVLRRRLEEAESTLEAIRNGEVDALVVSGGPGHKVYTLEGADHPYRILVEAMPQGAATLSTGGAILYCNSSLGQMVQRPCEKLVGTPIQALFAAADRARLEQRLAEAAEGRQEEMTLSGDNGIELPVLVSFNLLALEGSAALCLVITDLTEHHQNVSLKDTDRRKDEFLAMLAHELRNPLAPISNAVQMLSMENNGANADVQWACDVVARQVGQLTRIVDDLLDVSRITRGKIRLDLTTVALSTVIASSIETSLPLVASRRHELHVAIPDEPLEVRADTTRLSQVFINLLNNAAKYTAPGGHIWLSVQRAGPDAAITIRDDGDGIAADMLNNVFDLFTQADRAIDRSQGGLGIGLTLCRSLVDMHGGNIMAMSEGPGQGSQFVVRLPLAPKTRSTDSKSAAPTARRVAAQAAQRILVVDDNVDSALTLSMLMKLSGHDTRTAHDGPTAVELARAFRPTLVLLDLGLPGMDGYEVAEQLRKQPETRHAVVAALTGYGDEQNRQHCQESGFDHYMVKPLNYSALETLLNSLTATH